MSPAPIGERVASLETRVDGHEDDIQELRALARATGDNKLKMRVALLGLAGVAITAAGGLLTALLVTGGHP